MTDNSRPAIRHIVFFSAKDRADLPKIVAGLEELGKIPHSKVFEVRENTQADALSSEVDVVVYAEFASAADLAAYKADPIYAQAIKVVRPLRELRIAADI
ncbi:MAG: Dabb family protein [Litoreibacter sp.]|nr:Dabb family protein [Litoreibacter sp.]